jgi:hypothetical protein
MGRLVFVLGLLMLACGSSDGEGPPMRPATGTEGEACYANGTCNQGLSCLSKLCVSTVAGASGSGGTTSTSGGAPGTSGSGGISGSGAPTCFHASVTNSTAGEKVNAAFCFGLGEKDTYSCAFNPAANETRCIGSNSSYVVTYTETANGTVGDIYDLNGGQHIATVVQGPTGSYDIKLDSGGTGSCVVNGDVATLCVN